MKPVKITVQIGQERRTATWLAPSGGPVAPDVVGLVAAHEAGELAKGMVADIVGGLALTAYGNESTRKARPPRRMGRRGA